MAGIGRRAFAKLISMAAFAFVIPFGEPKKYGRVNTHERSYRGFPAHASVNGVEVSRRCYEADDIQGYALCYLEDERGRVMLNEDKSAILWERLNGDVCIW